MRPVPVCSLSQKSTVSAMISCEKLSKLIERMQRIVTHLNDRNDLVLHQQVNQFFYMQKIEELNVLLSQFDEINENLDALTSRIDEYYSLCFTQWCKDDRVGKGEFHP
jgi:prefoldin subunit 5